MTWVVPRRTFIRTPAAALGTSLVAPRARCVTAAELKVPDDASALRFEFDAGRNVVYAFLPRTHLAAICCDSAPSRSVDGSARS
jgi:hypothetical protein